MSAGNFVAVLALIVTVWSAFAILGEPWETPRAQLVVIAEDPAVYATRSAADAPPMLPDSMHVSAIGSRAPR
jgi:hypothetical protein